MNLALWLRFARRDLRSGLQGFWIFLTCLALGTATIAIIGSLTAAVERGLDEQGQPLLGGDVEFSLIHRETTDKEYKFIASKGEVSKAATVRAMAVAGGSTTLVEAKAIDANYPLYGTLTLEGEQQLEPALALKDGIHGAVADPLLMGRLGIKPGDRMALIGRNGTGKTTLLRIITGETSPSSGNVSIAKGTKIGFLPQEHLSFHTNNTVFEMAREAFLDVLTLQKEIQEKDGGILRRVSEAAARSG